MAFNKFSKIQKSVIACLCIMGLGLGMVKFPIWALESPVPDPVLHEISFNNFGIADGTYEYEGATELNAMGRYNGPLDGTIFSGNITITGSAGIDIRFGGKDMAWLGLRFYTKDGNLYMMDAQDRTDEYVFMAGESGTQLIGAQFNLKIGTQFVDSDFDGHTDDVKLGVWFNNTLYGENYIFLADYASSLGDWLGIFVTESGASISVASVQTNVIEVPDITLRKISFRNFGVPDATFTGIGDLNATGSYLGSLDGTIFSGNLTFSGNAQKDIRLGGVGGYWYGLRFYNNGSNLCMQDVEGNTPEYVFLPDIAQTEFEDTKFNLKVSFQFVDSDLDGTKDDVKLGVWFNDILYNNRYIYLTGYAPSLGSKLGVYVSNASSSLAIESESLSDPEVPEDTLKRITFLNFGIADATYQFTGGLSASGQYSGSLNGTIFNGDVTFTGPSAADIRYGGENLWYGLRFYNSGENLYMKDVGDKTAEYGFTPAMAGTQLVGAKFNLKITTQFVDADKDGTSDDARLGVWFNDVLYENNYIYLMNYAPYMGRRIGIYVSDNNSSLTTGSHIIEGQQEVLDPDLETITFRDFNIADGLYYYNNNDLSVKGSYNGTLNNTVLSGYITYSGSPGEQLRFAGKESEWHGLLFGSAGDGTLYLAEATERFAKITFHPEMAEIPLTGKRFNLKLSILFVDSDTDGRTDDVKLGVWFNNVLYANEYIYLTDYAEFVGNRMSLYISNKENTKVRLESVPYGKLESLDPSLNMFSFKQFRIADGKYYANGDLSVKGSYSVPLDQSVFSGNLLYSGKGVEEIRFYGKKDGWHGLRIFSKGDGNLYLADEPALNPEYQFSPGIAGTKLTGEMFNLKLSIRFVDYDFDQKKDDMQLGVWFNDRLYANEYIYFTNYVSVLGNYIGIYIKDKGSFIKIQSVIKPVDFSIFGLSANWEKDLFLQTDSDKPSSTSGSSGTSSSPNTSDSNEIMWMLMSASLLLIVLVGRTYYLQKTRN